MKASKLIQELQEHIKLHGDCEVRLDYWLESESLYESYVIKGSESLDFVYFRKEDNTIHLENF